MKRIIKIFYNLIICYCILQSSVNYLLNFEKIYSIEDSLIFLIFLMEDTTIYSPFYSEQAFKLIKKNMTEEEVIKVVGQPLQKQILENNKGELWRYTQGKLDRNFWLRCVKFDSNKKVSQIIKEYWAD